MFDLGRILRFLGQALKIFLPFLLLAIIPAFLVEIFPQIDEAADVLPTGRFWAYVGLLTLPVILAGLIPFWLAGRFIQAVYRLGSWWDGVLFLLRNRFGNWSFGPFAKIEEGEISLNPDNEMARIGGPGGLIVGIDSAVVLERGGKFTRVEGPGFPKLEPFEKIYDIIDLRPKSYHYDVSAMTKEGISINWTVEIRYQIADGGKPPPEKGQYPISEDDILRAATCKWIREDSWKHGQDMDWEGLVVVSRTEGALRSILARRRLDELIGLTEVDERTVREAVQEELEAVLRRAVPVLGAKILHVKLHKLEVKDEVTQQWIKFWQSRWQRWSSALLADGEANYIRQYETVKAETQIQMLTGIIQTLERQNAQRTMTAQEISQIVLMRLFSSLDRAEVDAAARIFLPSQALGALEQLREAVECRDRLPEAEIKAIERKES